MGMMLSRFLFSRIADRFSQGHVIAITCFMGAIIWIIAMLVNGITLKIVLVGVSAFFCGNNFPIIFSKACKLAPKKTATAHTRCSFFWILFFLIRLYTLNWHNCGYAIVKRSNDAYWGSFNSINTNSE